MDCSPPDSSVHGSLQARILEWVAIFSSRRSSRPRDGTFVSCLAGRFFTTESPALGTTQNSFVCACVLCHLSCLTLCDQGGLCQAARQSCSLPGFSVHGILQARILEWVAMPFSTGSFQTRDRTCVSCFAGGFLTCRTTSLPRQCPAKTQELSKWHSQCFAM